MKSLWSGLSPTLVLAVPATICYFVSYECVRLQMKDFYLQFKPGKMNFQLNLSVSNVFINIFHRIVPPFFHIDQTEQPFSVPLLAGMAARVFSVAVVSPLELIRTKMQSQKLSYYGE